MKQNGITYEEANPKEIEQRQSKLRAIPNANANANGIMRFHGTGSNSTSNGTSNASYFKVPFIEALDLVGNRKVYLEKGIAFVPFDHVVSILIARFRANLSQQLASAFRKFNRSIVSKDERLAPVLINLAKHHIGPDYSSIGQGVQGGGGAGDIKPEMIDTLASTSMPLCMKNLHQALKMQHHLKHGGRMQYGLFLKGAGLQLEDAISFWRQHFCKKMSVDDFNKKYAYNIRHNYGKEGKRKDYTPYNCMKIITGEPPKTGDYHGCPFRHHDEIHLLNQLKGIKEKNKQDILQLVQNRHYQIACKKYFEAIHPENEELEIMINHPNQFFEESRSYYASKAKQKQKNTNVLPSNFSSSSSSSTTTSTTSTTTTTTTTTQPLSQQKQQNPIAA
jgi:DNA primase large subunit